MEKSYGEVYDFYGTDVAFLIWENRYKNNVS
jgi:hypothetical protein